MARKKSPKTVVIKREPRKVAYNAQQLELVVERLREQAARLSAMSRSMEDARLKEVVIDGHQMLYRGLTQVDNFIDNGSRSIREARTAQLRR